MVPTYYQILGVGSGADFPELKKAYYRLAKRCHPDLFRNSPEKTREFQILVQAFDVLSDAGKRREYDLSQLTDRELMRRTRTRPEEPLMDSEADDILEELIVGNHVPPETSLATLLADLEKTEIFMAYREGRDHLLHRRIRAAEGCFHRIVSSAPENIVFRVYLARVLAARRKYGASLYHYRVAMEVGRSRVPMQHLNRVRLEYDEVRRRRHPLLGWFWKLFHEEPAEFIEDPAERMVQELSRSLTRAARTLELENRDDNEK